MITAISDRRAADMLCTAFEGGSNYWYVIVDEDRPKELAKPWGDDYTPSYISIPFSKGGRLHIGDLEDEEEPPKILDRGAIDNGKRLLATDERYSHHYANLLRENDDAITGDVFLQLCLFGEVIYG